MLEEMGVRKNKASTDNTRSAKPGKAKASAVGTRAKQSKSPP